MRKSPTWLTFFGFFASPSPLAAFPPFPFEPEGADPDPPATTGVGVETGLGEDEERGGDTLVSPRSSELLGTFVSANASDVFLSEAGVRRGLPEAIEVPHSSRFTEGAARGASRAIMRNAAALSN